MDVARVTKKLTPLQRKIILHGDESKRGINSGGWNASRYALYHKGIFKSFFGDELTDLGAEVAVLIRPNLDAGSIPAAPTNTGRHRHA